MLAYLQNNTFQCVLVSDGSRSYVIFKYGNIQWTAGRGSSDAVVGYNSASSSFMVPQSTTPAIAAAVVRTSNVGVNGTWAFRVNLGETGCSEESK